MFSITRLAVLLLPIATFANPTDVSASILAVSMDAQDTPTVSTQNVESQLENDRHHLHQVLDQDPLPDHGYSSQEPLHVPAPVSAPVLYAAPVVPTQDTFIAPAELPTEHPTHEHDHGFADKVKDFFHQGEDYAKGHHLGEHLKHGVHNLEHGIESAYHHGKEYAHDHHLGEHLKHGAQHLEHSIGSALHRGEDYIKDHHLGEKLEHGAHSVGDKLKSFWHKGKEYAHDHHLGEHLKHGAQHLEHGIESAYHHGKDYAKEHHFGEHLKNGAHSLEHGLESALHKGENYIHNHHGHHHGQEGFESGLQNNEDFIQGHSGHNEKHHGHHHEQEGEEIEGSHGSGIKGEVELLAHRMLSSFHRNQGHHGHKHHSHHGLHHHEGSHGHRGHHHKAHEKGEVEAFLNYLSREVEERQYEQGHVLVEDTVETVKELASELAAIATILKSNSHVADAAHQAPLPTAAAAQPAIVTAPGIQSITIVPVANNLVQQPKKSAAQSISREATMTVFLVTLTCLAML